MAIRQIIVAAIVLIIACATSGSISWANVAFRGCDGIKNTSSGLLTVCMQYENCIKQADRCSCQHNLESELIEISKNSQLVKSSYAKSILYDIGSSNSCSNKDNNIVKNQEKLERKSLTGEFCGTYDDDSIFLQNYESNYNKYKSNELSKLDGACLMHRKCLLESDKPEHTKFCKSNFTKYINNIKEDKNIKKDNKLIAMINMVENYYINTNKTKSEDIYDESYIKIAHESIESDNFTNLISSSSSYSKSNSDLHISTNTSLSFNWWKSMPDSRNLKFNSNNFIGLEFGGEASVGENSPFASLAGKWSIGENAENRKGYFSNENPSEKKGMFRGVSYFIAPQQALREAPENKSLSDVLTNTLFSSSISRKKSELQSQVNVQNSSILINGTASIQNRTIYGDFGAIKAGDNLAIKTTFDDISYGVSALHLHRYLNDAPINTDKDELSLSKFNIGLYRLKYRRPVVSENDIVDYYNCTRDCGSGYKYLIYDGKFKSTGIFINYAFDVINTLHDIDGWLQKSNIKIGSLVRYGTNNNVNLHDTQISMYTGNINYTGIMQEAYFTQNYQIPIKSIRTILNLETEIKLFYDAHYWGNNSFGYIMANDSDLIFGGTANVKLRF